MAGIIDRAESIAARVAEWLGKRLSQTQLLVLLAVMVGILAGLGASLLKVMIGGLTHLVTGGSASAHWWIVLLPVVGVLLSAIYSRYVVRDDLEYGTEKIARDLKDKNYRLRRHICYAPMVACTFTLGFGGSAGSEGPIAYTGAGLGSNFGKFFHLSPDMIRILIGCGAGAGIAGIFKAPIGGALFTLEVLQMPLTTVSVIALISSCLAASTMAYLCSGFTLDIAFTPIHEFVAPMTLAVALLGIFCGVYSLYYSFFMVKVETVAQRIKNHWVRNVLSGLLIGGLLFAFPALYGEGYGVVGSIINGHDGHLLDGTLFADATSPEMLLFYLAGILAVKSIATAATNSGGGVGGDFAPTLFAGAIAGLLFALLLNLVFGDNIHLLMIPVGLFAVFGMAGVMAGAIQAPLMAIFLTSEMVGDFGLLFPIMVCAVVSYLTVRLLHIRYHINFRPSWLHHHDFADLIKHL